jgi:hypothetical protein
MIGFLNSASPDAFAAPFRADFALCVTETGLAGWGPGTQQKRDTKKGPLRQEAGMAPPLPNSAHGDQLISAKPRSTAVFERPTARTMLIAAAAQRWRVSAASCRAERGKVVHVPTGRSKESGLT